MFYIFIDNLIIDNKRPCNDKTNFWTSQKLGIRWHLTFQNVQAIQWFQFVFKFFQKKYLNVTK